MSHLCINDMNEVARDYPGLTTLSFQLLAKKIRSDIYLILAQLYLIVAYMNLVVGLHSSRINIPLFLYDYYCMTVG